MRREICILGLTLGFEVFEGVVKEKDSNLLDLLSHRRTLSAFWRASFGSAYTLYSVFGAQRLDDWRVHFDSHKRAAFYIIKE